MNELLFKLFDLWDDKETIKFVCIGIGKCENRRIENALVKEPRVMKHERRVQRGRKKYICFITVV